MAKRIQGVMPFPPKRKRLLTMLNNKSKLIRGDRRKLKALRLGLLVCGAVLTLQIMTGLTRKWPLHYFLFV